MLLAGGLVCCILESIDLLSTTVSSVWLPANFDVLRQMSTVIVWGSQRTGCSVLLNMG